MSEPFYCPACDATKTTAGSGQEVPCCPDCGSTNLRRLHFEGEGGCAWCSSPGGRRADDCPKWYWAESHLAERWQGPYDNKEHIRAEFSDGYMVPEKVVSDEGFWDEVASKIAYDLDRVDESLAEDSLIDPDEPFMEDIVGFEKKLSAWLHASFKRCNWRCVDLSLAEEVHPDAD